MDSLDELLKKKADLIDKGGRKDDLDLIQAELDRFFDGAARARQINKFGVALITTDSASVASELRFQSFSLLQNLEKNLKQPLKRLQIRIQK